MRSTTIHPQRVPQYIHSSRFADLEHCLVGEYFKRSENLLLIASRSLKKQIDVLSCSQEPLLVDRYSAYDHIQSALVVERGAELY